MFRSSRRALWATASVALLTAGLAGCAPADDGSTAEPAEDCVPRWEFSTIEEGVLTIASVQQMPAADVDPQSGEMEGLDPVLLERFAADACLETSWNPQSGPAASAALTEGAADVGAGGFFRSEARGEVMGQTTPTWLDSPGVLSPIGISTVDEMIGKRIGVVGGAVFEKPLGEVIGTDNVIPYQSLDAILQDLTAGRIDAALNSGGVLTYQRATRGLDDMTVAILAPDPGYPVLTAPGEPNFPHTKSNTALGEALDDFLAEVHADGTVVDVLKSYGIEDPQTN